VHRPRHHARPCAARHAGGAAATGAMPSGDHLLLRRRPAGRVVVRELPLRGVVFSGSPHRRHRPGLCRLPPASTLASNIAMSKDTRPLCALTIAGSDSGGGAGIQADLKTFAAHGVHGLSAIAALTAQNTRGVRAVHVPPVAFLRAQIDACFDDFHIGAVKLGMLANARVIHAVADALEHYRPKYIVLDPVMVASSGAKLLADSALEALRERLIPLATVITPNIPEAEFLLGHPIRNADEAEAA